ncbi:MAG: 5'-3' exonuclease [Actinobacteria bacterium]|nr:5'-3' exonuclease [Actinomycetota bacterium]
MVLDSASLYYRSFFALPEKMTAPDGRPHNAVRGFLSTVTRLVDMHDPTALVACWDADWRPAWRVELVPTYKAHRVADEGAPDGSGGEAEPESLGPQAVAIAELLDAMGLSRWGVEGYEADDVIGSVVAQSTDPCIVVTGDRDLVQLIDAHTRVLLTVNGGMEKWPLIDQDAARDRFGVPPDRYVDLAVLRGDPSDGLPGVPGIGAKTAAALVLAFGSMDGILAAASAATPVRPMTPRLAGALLDNADAIGRAERVTTVVRDLDLSGPVPSLSGRTGDPAALAGLAARWGVQRQVADLLAALDRQTVDE